MPDPQVFNQRDVGQVGGQVGLAVLDFGAAPGASDTSVVVQFQSGIDANAILDAWIVATMTVDHSVDEHWSDPPAVMAGNIVPGVGFTIYGKTNDIGDGQTVYGKWSVAWQWFN